MVVITHNDQALAEKLADELANMCWQQRHKMPPSFTSPKEALERARKARLRRKLGVVTISDASDVVTAGSTGENTALIRGFIEHGKDLVCYAGLRDPQIVDELWDTAEGEIVNVSVGGTLTHFAAPPVLMVASPWDFDTVHMLTNFGWKATLGILLSNALYFVIFRAQFRQLEERFALRRLKDEVRKNFLPRDLMEADWDAIHPVIMQDQQFGQRLEAQIADVADKHRARLAQGSADRRDVGGP